MKILIALLLSGCASFSPVTIAREFKTIGWFKADDASRWQQVDNEIGCEVLASRVPEGEVIVLVHGVKGDGEEINTLMPTLARAKPSAVFLYRWVAWDDRDSIAKGFAAGVSHLLECLPWLDGRLLVLAHSAGGIVVSYGATLIRIPRRERTAAALYVITVSAPLAGMNERAPNADGRAEARFMLDFGTRIAGYPVAPLALSAVHLRTQYPGDQVMKPTQHHAPNNPAIGLPGAPHIDLPAELTHDGALSYVAEKIADGSWRGWFAPQAR